MENMNDNNIENDVNEDSQNNYNEKNIEKSVKTIMSILLIMEIAITSSTIIASGFYDFFWKINGYVFTWFWLKGLLGIILFSIVLYDGKIIFKKSYIGFLIIPIVFSVLSFIGVIRGIIHPRNHNYYITEFIKEMCYVVGFPLWILCFLQEKYKVNKFLIGMSAFLTPLARFVVSFIVWAS